MRAVIFFGAQHRRDVDSGLKALLDALCVALMIEGQDGLTWPRWQRLAAAVDDLSGAWSAQRGKWLSSCVRSPRRVPSG